MNQRNLRRTGIRKLPSGRYQITFRDGNGVKHRESFDREKDARAAQDERRTAVRNREYVALAKIPTVEQAARAWLDGKKVSESKHGGPIKESSLEFWANHINRFIAPTLGAYRLDIVDTALIEKKRDAWKELGLTGVSVNKVLTVRRNWSGRYRDGEPVFSTPKSKHSIRKVRVPDELCLALKKWKLQCPPSKWDLVFPRADGRPQDRKTTWRAFDAAIKKANENARDDEKLRRLTVHSLRHSFASIHLMNGTPIPDRFIVQTCRGDFQREQTGWRSSWPP